MSTKLPRVKGYKDFTHTENKEGLPLEFVTDGRGVSSTFSIPERFAGWRTDSFVAAHPGAIDTVLTTIMGRAAIFGLKKAAQIRSMSVDYFDLVPTEVKLQAQARVIRERGDREAVIEARIRDEHGVLLAKCTGTWALFSTAELNPASGLARMAGAACNPAMLAEFESMLKD